MKPTATDKARRAVARAYMACVDRAYPRDAWALARCAAYALAAGNLLRAVVDARAACTAARRAKRPA